MVTHFTDLTVYKLSFNLAGRIFVLSKRWPPEERYSLTDQSRRAARSVGASVAESWAKRRYPAHFLSKLTDADAENHELEHWLLSAERDGYLNAAESEVLIGAKRQVGRMLGGMLQNPDPFLL
jgi:four helix bundle protein